MSALDLQPNYLALLGAVMGLDPEQSLMIFGLHRSVRLPKQYLDDRDSQIIEMRSAGLPWYQIGRALNMDAKTAQKAYARRMAK